MTPRSTLRTTLPSRLTLLLLTGAALVAALVACLGTAGPAAAASYRYWGYFQGSTGTWEFAQTGPDDYTVVDQDVQGWRFGISTETTTPKPDNAPDFATLCPELAGSTAPEGQVRVAVVIDSGFAADAPEGQTPPADEIGCVTVPTGSTGTQALSRAATVTSQDSLVCAINGYPADECGASISDADASEAAAASTTESPNPAEPASPTPTASGSATDSPTPVASAEESAPSEDASDVDSGSALPLVIGGAVVVIVLVGLIVVSQRKRADSEDAEGHDEDTEQPA